MKSTVNRKLTRTNMSGHFKIQNERRIENKPTTYQQDLTKLQGQEL
jgi:hypothetical protein